MEIIVITLTILCICNYAMLAAILIRLSGGLLKIDRHKFVAEHNVTNHSTQPASDKYEAEELDRIKRQSIAEAKAFQEIMNYNTDVAYGVYPKEG